MRPARGPLGLVLSLATALTVGAVLLPALDQTERVAAAAPATHTPRALPPLRHRSGAGLSSAAARGGGILADRVTVYLVASEEHANALRRGIEAANQTQHLLDQPLFPAVVLLARDPAEEALAWLTLHEIDETRSPHGLPAADVIDLRPA